MKLESYHSDEDKAKWEIVHLQDGRAVKCKAIVTADDALGECAVVRTDTEGKDQTVTLSFGPGMIRLVSKGRR